MSRTISCGIALGLWLASVPGVGASARQSVDGNAENSAAGSATLIADDLLPAPLPLSWCLERALQLNPELLEMLAMADAARERTHVVGALDDPRFSYEASNIPVRDFDFKSTPLSGHQFGLRQKLPMPGLLSARSGSAERSGRAAVFEVEDRKRFIAGAVEQAWARLGFAQRAVEIADRNIETLGQLAQMTEVRYSVGSGQQPDVLRAQVEQTMQLQQRLKRVAMLETAEARLAALLDLPASSEFPRTASLEEVAAVPPLESLHVRTREANARLKALRERVAAAELELRAAKLEGLPDVDLGVGYRVRERVKGDAVDGDDFVSAGFTIRLPVDRARWRANEAQHRALVRRSKAILRKHQNALMEQVEAAHAELVRADREAELLRTGLVPQAVQSLESSRSAYEVGRIDFSELLDSQVRLLVAQLQEVRAVADRRVAFGVLESIVGEELR